MINFSADKLFQPAKSHIFFYLLIIVLFSSCTASRSVINSGKVTPQGDVKFGANMGANLATETISAMSGVVYSASNNIKNNDSLRYDEHVDKFSKALVSYSLDPANVTADFYIRYGLIKRLDIGYKFFSGVHVFDAMFQFMGSTGTINNPGEENTKINGSIGFQYSSQKSKLPEKLHLDKLSAYLNFDASRKDIMIPLVFSLSLGPEEKNGHLGAGLIYNHTFIEYNFQPDRIVTSYAGSYANVSLPSLSTKKSFSSFGMFINGKIGYKYVYFLASLSIFYQDYGKYEIPGGKIVDLSGLTFIPNAGLQFHLFTGKGSKNTTE